MQEPRTTPSAGLGVVVRDEAWTVLRADRFDVVDLVLLRGVAPDNRDEVSAVLLPADRIEPLPVRAGLRQRSRHAVLGAAVQAVAEAAPWDQCWTAAHARIDRRSWQLEPASAAVRGAMRILLADEVGLGKTIQAALIISELRARGLAERVLVLTPASIRDQWAGELHDRFGLQPSVFDPSSLAITAAALPPGVNPWRTAPLIISSIDLVKRPEVRAALEAVPFDVLVVDEAHHLSPGTDRGALVAELAGRTPWVVLATATPHGGDEEAFQFLRRLGDVGTEDVLTFRRSRRRGPGVEGRRTRLFFVRPTHAERALLDATRDYALTVRRTSPGARLVAAVIARRAASSADAVHHTLMRRIALLNGSRSLEDATAPEQQAQLPWEEDDTDAVGDAVLCTPGLRDLAHEIEWLGHLAVLAHGARAHPSKVDVIRRLLRRTREQVLVFSEYRDVATQVAAALADLCEVAPLHGGLSPRERRDVVRAFNGGRIRVLVATDAAGEGLNLQARCRLVINMELPWTPRRLEQRIGRVDRLGQRRRVHALHLAHRQTYEGTVIARLERRRAHVLRASRAGDAVGLETTVSVAPGELSPAGRHAIVRPTEAVYASRGRSGRSRVVLVYRVPLMDGAGRLVQRSVVACQVACAAAAGFRLSRELTRSLAADEAVQRTLEPEVDRLAATAHTMTSAAAVAMDRRLTALAAHLDRLRAAGVWQASLFDRRAEQRAHARASSVEELQQHLRQRARSVRTLGHVATGKPQLVAAWLE